MPRKAKSRTLFAERLAQIRKTRGLSQRELARLTDVSPRVIGLYETIIKNPTPAVVVRIAKSLKVSIDDLMGNKPIKEGEYFSRKVIQRAKRLQELPPRDQKRAMEYIDLLHLNHFQPKK